MNKKWHLYALEEPETDGVYDVRIEKKNELLSPTVEVIMEYSNGTWSGISSFLIGEYKIIAWRSR